jgi:hypothetical protein
MTILLIHLGRGLASNFHCSIDVQKDCFSNHHYFLETASVTFFLLPKVHHDTVLKERVNCC